MSSSLHVVRAGAGPTLLMVHGSAADHTTWSIQLASNLAEWFTLVAYDRRVGPEGRSESGPLHPGATVEDHARDAVALLGDPPEPAIVVGSSFGSVIALELLRSHPGRCAGAVLIEPPMPASDDQVAASTAFLDEFERRLAEQGGPAAAEFFLRFVLGDQPYERMPRSFQERAKAKWSQIRSDAAALLAYRPRYAELAQVTTPVLLLGGDRSATYFRATLEALHAALPAARLETVAGAGHMLHAEAPRRFAELLVRFAVEIGIR